MSRRRCIQCGEGWCDSTADDVCSSCRVPAGGSGGMGPVVTPEPLCRNCGEAINDHRLANFADGPHIGANFLVCQKATYQPAHALGAVPTGVADE